MIFNHVFKQTTGSIAQRQVYKAELLIFRKLYNVKVTMFRGRPLFHSVDDFIELRPKNHDIEEINLHPVENEINYESKTKFINDYEIFMYLPIQNDLELENLLIMLNDDVKDYNLTLREEEISHFNQPFFEKLFICLNSPNGDLVRYSLQLLYSIIVYFSHIDQVLDNMNAQYVESVMEIARNQQTISMKALEFLYLLFFTSEQHFSLSFPYFVEIVEMSKEKASPKLIDQSIEFMYKIVKDDYNVLEFPQNFVYDFLLWAYQQNRNTLKVLLTTYFAFEHFRENLDKFVHFSSLFGRILVTLSDSTGQEKTQALNILIWLMDNTELITIDNVIEAVHHLDAILHDETECAIKAWEFMEKVANSTTQMAERLMETNFVQNFLDIFKAPSKVCVDAKIHAEFAICYFLLFLPEERFEFLPMSEIISNLEEAEVDETLPEELLSKVKSKLGVE